MEKKAFVEPQAIKVEFDFAETIVASGVAGQTPARPVDDWNRVDIEITP